MVGGTAEGDSEEEVEGRCGGEVRFDHSGGRIWREWGVLILEKGSDGDHEGAFDSWGGARKNGRKII